MFKTIRITSIITFVLLLFGMLFKTMHWPGANVLLSIGTLTGILLFITLLAGIVPKLSGGMEKVSVIIASITMIIALLALVCKTLHWPGANIFIWTADIGLFLSSIAFLVDGLLEKDTRMLGIKIVMAFFALLLALIAILSRIAG